MGESAQGINRAPKRRPPLRCNSPNARKVTRKLRRLATTLTSWGAPAQCCAPLRAGNLRLVPDAQLSPGKAHSAGHANVALGRLQGELGQRGLALVRGDGGDSNEDIIDHDPVDNPQM